jgi:hypothetical protein
MGDFDGARSDCRLGVWLYGRAKSDLRLALGSRARLVATMEPNRISLSVFYDVFGRFEEKVLL